jgi:hypothetical protein
MARWCVGVGLEGAIIAGYSPAVDSVSMIAERDA